MDLDLLDEALDGEPAYRRTQVYEALTRSFVGGWDDVTTLPRQLRAKLADRVPFSTVATTGTKRSDDGSVKLLMSTADGYPVEAVLMRFDEPFGKKPSRYTACLSSQSGCALACSFCATGSMGFGRSLTRYEILDQLLAVARLRQADGRGRIDNVVMMGMGEPLQNYDEVLAACRLMNDPSGLGLGARRIAVSTAGWVPGIDRLTAESLQVKLAVSLHAPNDEVRGAIMPVNRRFPVEVVMAACRRYRTATRRRVFIEYLLLSGVNDSPDHARELANLLGREGFHVNLIAYNATIRQYQAASTETARRFSAVLTRSEVSNSYRVSRGQDIDAACGQLASPLSARDGRSQ